MWEQNLLAPKSAALMPPFLGSLLSVGKISDYYHAGHLNFIKFNAWQNELHACPCVIGVKFYKI